MDDYDYIIAGGGASGITLAKMLIESGLGAKVLMIEKSKKLENDRSWCFWDPVGLPYLMPSSFTWNSVQVSTKKFEKKVKLTPYQYHYFRAGDFYTSQMNLLLQAPNFTLKQENIQFISGSETGGVVWTEKGKYEGKWVFNSLPQFAPIIRPVKKGIKQHFLGHWIETKEPVFDPACMTLMDFQTGKGGEVQFVYVLPVSRTKALVEYTVFSDIPWQDEQYDAAIRAYMSEKFGVDEYHITESESGIIPMSAEPFARITENRIVHIGSAGGLTKASTGYTFHRIYEDSRRLVRDLIRHGRPYPKFTTTGRFAFYDRLMLWLIRHQPRKIPGIMYKLFSRNPSSRVLRFLSEKTWFG
ncbi:MAG: lycopene cyclase family protein, partial [Bacteroidota bacterium]